MPILNKKLFGASVTASIVRAGGKCWKRLTSTAATTPDYTQNQIVSTCASDAICLGLNCSGNKPSMILTVTGTTGTINWCGKTWNLPTDSGKDKEVCPTYYYYDPPDPTYDTIVGHSWGNVGELGLGRRYAGYGPPPFGGFIETARIGLIVKGVSDYMYRYYSNFVGWTTKTYIPDVFSLGVLSVGDMPATPTRYTAWKLLEKQFGQFTTGSVTYSWRKGSNWPTN